MSIRYLVEDGLIPNDGSKEIIESFYKSTGDKSLELIIYPDVHHKKGSRVVNGMLTSSADNIYPSMLGVANCGFTFGFLENASIEQRDDLEKTFEKYSKILKAHNNTYTFSKKEVLGLFNQYLEEFYKKDQYKAIFEHIGVRSLTDISKMVKDVLTPDHLEAAAKTLGTLGGGNHFFELQYVEETYEYDIIKNQIVFILHSDSIAVGDKINLLFSNLSELDHLVGIRGKASRLLKRFRQLDYFIFKNNLFFREHKEIVNLLFSQNDYRTINANTETGKNLIKAFFLASIFGDMNRDMILKRYMDVAKVQLPNLSMRVLGSHSHDSIMVEKNSNKIRIVQRNGVQCILGSQKYILPGALGTESYIMSNPNNEDVYYSSNHGVGRLLDKHLAREKFDKNSTEEELKKRNLKVYKVGSGDISEQNPHAFKNVNAVIEVMEKQNLGGKVAKLRPICSIKG
jgi:RNA-splicing ligase RtcB